MKETEIQEKLQKVSNYLKGNNYKINVGRLNKLMKYATDAWLLIDPVTGIAAKGAQFASDLLSDLLEKLSVTEQKDINRIFNEILDSHNAQLRKLLDLLYALIPKASVTYSQNSFKILNGHGIDAISDHSNHCFSLHLSEPIEKPSDYFVHCNIPGAKSAVSANEITVTLPADWDWTVDTAIKILVQRMDYSQFEM